MKFKKRDKVILKDNMLKKAGLGDTKIKNGIVERYQKPFVWIKRGRGFLEQWHEDFWIKSEVQKMPIINRGRSVADRKTRKLMVFQVMKPKYVC